MPLAVCMPSLCAGLVAKTMNGCLRRRLKERSPSRALLQMGSYSRALDGRQPGAGIPESFAALLQARAVSESRGKNWRPIPPQVDVHGKPEAALQAAFQRFLPRIVQGDLILVDRTPVSFRGHRVQCPSPREVHRASTVDALRAVQSMQSRAVRCKSSMPQA
jgi:hypothetical protein